MTAVKKDSIESDFDFDANGNGSCVRPRFMVTRLAKKRPRRSATWIARVATCGNAQDGRGNEDEISGGFYKQNNLRR